MRDRQRRRLPLSAESFAQATKVRNGAGSPGASGLPLLMTSDAIRSSAANFQQCLQSLAPPVAKARHSKAMNTTRCTRDLGRRI